MARPPMAWTALMDRSMAGSATGTPDGVSPSWSPRSASTACTLVFFPATKGGMVSG